MPTIPIKTEAAAAYLRVKYCLLSVIDNGRDGRPVDAILTTFSFSPFDCSTFPFATSGQFLDGDVRVRDLTR